MKPPARGHGTKRFRDRVEVTDNPPFSDLSGHHSRYVPLQMRPMSLAGMPPRLSGMNGFESGRAWAAGCPFRGSRVRNRDRSGPALKEVFPIRSPESNPILASDESNSRFSKDDSYARRRIVGRTTAIADRNVDKRQQQKKPRRSPSAAFAFQPGRSPYAASWRSTKGRMPPFLK